MLGLETIAELLLEKAVAVQDSVANCRQILRCARIQEASCKASETTISEGRVGLLFKNLRKIVTKCLCSLFCLIYKTKVKEVVEEGTAHEELSGEVVLAPTLAVELLGCVPVVGDLVYH